MNREDLHGHGTHVAGIAAGAWSGAAPHANIINVKVLAPNVTDRNSPGQRPTNGGIAQALSDVTVEHMSKRGRKPSGWRGSVINMSLRTRDTPVLRAATVAAFLAGIPISTSAGNKNILTDQAPCKYTGSTVCVASSNETYQKSWFSNYGPNVFIIAPGSNITAASHEADNYVTTKSGTSMASPLVAGVMANFVSFEGLWDDVPEVWKRLRSNQLSNIIGGFPTGAGDQTTNAFLNNGINSPSKRSIDPYAGIPRDELKLAAEVEAAIAADSSNVISAAAAPFPTFFNISREHLTDTGGPTATITTEVDTEYAVADELSEWV
ncbi:hypothetical protein SLS63_008229 [Diaporthe eres]|uniref:Peptidase S8/S53 domain-containing protein n=1 Tax=Diaporthe eres TaxID=83184 RepID=A0ABR1P314_DIAER